VDALTILSRKRKAFSDSDPISTGQKSEQQIPIWHWQATFSFGHQKNNETMTYHRCTALNQLIVAVPSYLKSDVSSTSGCWSDPIWVPRQTMPP
jgi:hypothetical protein